jgi:RNA polymerase sigma-70 factor (ECF subfamily)
MTGRPTTSDEWDWDSARALCLRETQRVLGRIATAEDAAQEAVTRVWRHRATCQTPDGPGPWMAAIARREALRAAVRPAELPLEDAGPLFVEDRVDEIASRVDLHRAVRGLPQLDRQLLIARYWADLTQPQAAKRMRLAEGTVKVRLHRARVRLHAALSSP